MDYSSDMTSTLAKEIVRKASAVPEGTPLLAKEFLHLGSRAAVDQSLSRLVKSGQLIRAGRGIYVRPVDTRFGVRPPSVPRVVEGLAALKGEAVVPHGAAAANALGLTTQVPMRTVYLTSGRTRRLSLGAQSIELRHAPPWQLALPQGRAGQAIRALAWFGRARAGEALQALQGKLSNSERQELAKVQGRLPTWMASQLGALAHG
ncbi:MAG: DUF6088 family protein [Myxococcaceae bacterium]